MENNVIGRLLNNDPGKPGNYYPLDDQADSYYIVGKNKSDQIIANGVKRGFMGRTLLLNKKELEWEDNMSLIDSCIITEEMTRVMCQE